MHAVALSSRPPRTDCSDVQGPSWSSGCALAGPGNLALLTRARAPETPRRSLRASYRATKGCWHGPRWIPRGPSTLPLVLTFIPGKVGASPPANLRLLPSDLL